jgi:4-amino-4-deoxy-L-arabinose transferase-like glycosyltransferase
MKNKQNLLLKIGCSVIILIGVLFVLIPISPYNSPYSYRDSGVFLYSGWRILEGDIPYVDFWDHNPPIIFYINAIGLGLTNNSVWGVWAIELIFLFLSSVIAFRLLSQLFGFYSASVNTFLWLLALFFMIQGGNLTTEYTLLFQFGALSLFYFSQKKQKKFIYLILIGVLGGLAFFTKQITIGIWLAMIIYLLFTGIKNNELITAIKKAAMILAGFLIVSLIIFGYFLFRGAVGELWEAAFIYNFAYSIRKVSGIKARILGILDFSSLMHTGIFYFSLLGIILFLIIDSTEKTIGQH